MRSQLQTTLHALESGRKRHRYPIAIGYLLLGLLIRLPHSVAAEPQPSDVSARTINEITVPATHNSYNYAPKFQLPNANESVTEQLQNGVRGIELDPNYLGKEIQVFHGAGSLMGAQPASEVLAEVLTFVQQNPSEIVVLKMQSKIPIPDLAALINRVGLSPYLYVRKKGEPVPTSAELAQTNRRVLIVNTRGKLSSRLSLCSTQWDLKTPEALWPPREHRAPCKGEFFSVIAYAVDATLGTGSPDHAARD